MGTSTRLKGHKGPVYRCVLTADGNYVLSAGHDRSLKLWNPHKSSFIEGQGSEMKIQTAASKSQNLEWAQDKERDGLLVHSYDNVHGYEVVDVAVTHDNSRFLSCGGDKLAYLWDVKAGRVVRKLFGHEQRLNAVCLKPKDSTVAMTASYDATVRLWDLRQFNSRPIQILKDFKDSVTSVCCSEDEIMACSMDGFVYVYDIRAGRLYKDKFGAGISWISLSSDDKCILSSCLSSPAPQLCLTEKSSGNMLQSYSGHENTGYRLTNCFDNHDETVFSGSESSEIFQWDLVSGKVLKVFKGLHSRAVSSICFHPNDPAFVSSSYDGTCIYHEI